MSLRNGLLGALAVLSVAGWASAAPADEVVTTTYYAGPNRGLLWSGAIAAGVPYISSVVVAAESSHPGDEALYIPVAGPWVDLAQRGGCPVSVMSCNGETLNKVLLVGDGLFQAVGSIAILAAFLAPEHRHHHYASEPKLQLAPLTLRGGSGFAVFGSF
jgi:hypothetical protein